MAHPKTIQEMQELLRIAEQRAEEAERGRQEERHRAEREQQRAEEAERGRQEERHRAEREQQRADEAEEQTRRTTLDEYITACHDLVFSKFAVQTDKTLTSRGPITNPRNKWCPTNLKPWSDFLEQQRHVFGTLRDTLPTDDNQLFESRGFLAGLGTRISRRLVGDEKTLEYFLHNSVEDPVREIIEQLRLVEEINGIFDLGNGIIFENHPHSISDVSPEVVGSEAPSTPRTPDHNKLDLNQLRPDQICVYRSNGGPSENRTIIYVSEYKPPHKLTAPHLRLGLRAMNIPRDVVNRKTIPTLADSDARFQYHAERLTASALTQTYHYMIEGGLEHGLLTTGEAIVFLKVDWAEPETLYYHLAEPGPEVAAHPDHFHICTAVGQYLAFSLIALGSLGRRRVPGQDDRQRVTMGLKTWAEDFETTLWSIPESERSLSTCSPDSPAYVPTTYKGFDRSPHLRRGKRRRLCLGDQVEMEALRNDAPELSDDEVAPGPPDTPSRRGTGSRRQETRHSQRQHVAPQRPHTGGEQSRQYCTQKCFLGLVRGRFLDPKCPNVALHHGQGNCDGGEGRNHSNTLGLVRHPVSHTMWLQLLRKQLERTLDDGITPLGQGGARGVLFQVTLLAYGYTCIAKGTVRAFIRDLEHEAAVYKRLQPVQGVNVPVFLGAIDLQPMNRIYYYDHRVYVVHMTFLSWAGNQIDLPETVDGKGELLESMAVRSLRAVHQEGVVHKDVRAPNMLFCPETNGVMIIDFERSLLLTPYRHPLVQMVPNKRGWEQETTDVKKATADRSKPSRSSRGFQEDIHMARVAFLDEEIYR
jgi:hypothetical protein